MDQNNNSVNEKRVCSFCYKPLVKIGRDRQNGKGNYNDWKTRKYHVKCYKYYKYTEE